MLLRNKNVFIGGPIQFAISEDGFDRELKTTIQIAVETVRSLGGKVLSAHLLERFGEDTPQFTPEMVSRRDFQWMKECDLFISILSINESNGLLRSDGSHIELGWASALSRPVLLITKLPIVDGGSHLLKGLEHISKVYKLDIDEFRNNPKKIADPFFDLFPQKSVSGV